jgi:CBS domain-containing protein
VVTYPDELVYDAAAKMLRQKVGRLPVVDRADSTRLLGYIGRPGILAARVRRMDEEHLREPGWITGYAWFRRSSRSV